MVIPIDVRHLFKSLDEKLISLLASLSNDDWEKPTVASLWRVKDVASHLLDGNIRALSIQRDRYFGEKPVGVNSYRELVDWLNQLNADWVKATSRISPEMLIYLHQITGPITSEYFASLDPWKEAIFPVDWAGERTSYNWMHVAREYSEKWHHQQQIRDAVKKEGIMTRKYFYPAMSTFCMGLPHTFKSVNALEGTVVQVHIPGEIGGDWYLFKSAGDWKLVNDPGVSVAAKVEIPAKIAWKLFTKSLRPKQIINQVSITGDKQLAEKVLDMVSVMG